MRAAIYVRVSTEEQAVEGYSVGAQKELLQDYCLAEGWDVTAVYEDDGYSGRSDKRPAYRRMMAEMDLWDVVVVIKMDRIHRNSRNFMNMMDTLEKHGKMFVSSSESLDTTNALGRFVVDMIQRLAQLESEQIGERTYMGMREKAETLDSADTGKRTMGFTPPFGYRLRDGALVEDEDELPIVRRMFEEYSEGRTVDQICYSLNSEGILTRRGNPWNKRNMANILHNPVYAGYMRWEDLLIRHRATAPLTPGEFNDVQNRMASKVRDPSKRTVHLIPTEDDFLDEF
ncbi:recombinase family protein [Candidatus Methanoprimaticola sp. MG2]|uniref:recombinase family protein n=1 Tax=Candidatus Methanoprimaticola sp. MG2 TaxID=3228838 RepID=UPI0039C5AD98